MKTIRDYRNEAMWTQRELAARLGVTVQTVSNWEVCRNEPTARQLVALAHALGVGCDEIVLPFDERRSAGDAVESADDG